MFDSKVDKINTIQVKELKKTFDKTVEAVKGISFTVKEGEILGFLGPNGAGKTTTLNMLSTLLRPTSGTATINGHDILKDPDAVRRSIGYVFQDTTLDIELTGKENLDFHGRLYGLDHKKRKERIENLLGLVQLTDRADNFVKTYSGGMKRRLEIARGLLHHPKVLFLDEPTLGLDPQTRRSIWEHILRLNKEQKVTIMLTTHYTEEADYLCDNILIIDFGKIIVNDNPDNLKARLKGDVISLVFKDPTKIQNFQSVLEQQKWIHKINAIDASDKNYAAMNGFVQTTKKVPNKNGIEPLQNVDSINSQTPPTNEEENNKNLQFTVKKCVNCLNLLVDNGGHRIPEIVKLANDQKISLESVELHKPTLDDVFLSITGRKIREEEGSFIDMVRRRRIVRQARGRKVRG